MFTKFADAYFCRFHGCVLCVRNSMGGGLLEMPGRGVGGLLVENWRHNY